MPANQPIRERYDEYRKAVCQWCVKGELDCVVDPREGHDDLCIHVDKEGLWVVDCDSKSFEAWAAWKIERLEAALKYAIAVLGTGECCEANSCDSCKIELKEAIASLKAALAAQPETEATK